MEQLFHAGVAGGLGWAGSKYLLGNTGTVTINGTSIDKSVAFGITVGVADGIAEVAKDYVLPKIPLTQNPSINKMIQNSVPPALCGTAAVCLEKALVSELPGIYGTPGAAAGPTFVVAAGCSVGATFATDTYYKK
jgi:hypothetical protein